jgi:hypothetical protein
MGFIISMEFASRCRSYFDVAALFLLLHRQADQGRAEDHAALSERGPNAWMA